MKYKFTVDGVSYVLREPTIKLMRISKDSGKSGDELIKNCLESIDGVAVEIGLLEKTYDAIPMAHLLAIDKHLNELMGKLIDSTKVELLFLEM